MKLTVLKQFHDKVTGAIYKAGSEIEVSDKRGAEILAAPGNLAVKVESSKSNGSKNNKSKGDKPEGEGSKDEGSKDENKNE